MEKAEKRTVGSRLYNWVLIKIFKGCFCIPRFRGTFV